MIDADDMSIVVVDAEIGGSGIDRHYEMIFFGR